MDLARGWYWCERIFHSSRRPFQYGRSRTLASRSYASRASANDAFALDDASRQAPRLESFLEDARSLLLHLPTSLRNRALCHHFKKSDKKCSARVHLTRSPRRPPVKSRLSRVPWLRTRCAPSTGASYNTGALLAALSVASSAGCT